MATNLSFGNEKWTDSTGAVPIGNAEATAQSVAGSRFEDLYNSNPYLQLPRQRTVWDRLLNFFGARSGYDRAMEQYSLAGSEYNAQLAQLASEEQYNTPAEQAMRMRQGGMNPDLLGTEGVSPASEFDNQQQSPDVNASAMEDLERLGSIRQAFGTFASNALGLLGTVGSVVESGVGILGKIQDIDTNSLGQIGDIIDSIEKLTPSLMDSLRDMDDPEQISDYLKKDYSGVLQPLIPNPRMRKRVIDYLSNYYGSMQNVANEYNAKTATDTARVNFNKQRGEATFHERDDIMQTAYNMLSKDTYEIAKLENKYMLDYLGGLKGKNRSYFENAQYSYQASLFNNLDASKIAGAQNAQAAYTDGLYSGMDPSAESAARNEEAKLREVSAARERDMQEVYKKVQESYANFLSYLAKEASKGSFLAKMTMIRLSSSMEGILPPMFSIKDKRPNIGQIALPALVGALTRSPGAAAAAGSFLGTFDDPIGLGTN